MFVGLILLMLSLLFALTFVVWCCERGINIRLPKTVLGRIVATTMVSGFILYAGTKNGFTMLPPSTTVPAQNIQRKLTDANYSSGFVLQSICTNEVFDFSAPADATLVTNWLAHGAAEDHLLVPFNDWAFPFGTNALRKLTLFSRGMLVPQRTDMSTIISPFFATLGVVPRANWSDAPSQVWYKITDDWSFVFTWQNVLLNRLTTSPVSFQVELKYNGDFVFRYDLSRVTNEQLTNILIGATNGGKGYGVPVAFTNLSSLAFCRVSEEDRVNIDVDGDGLTTEDEIFVYGTDPHLADTDGDGVSDGDEVARGTNPATRDSDGDGLVDASDPEPLVTTPLDDNDADGIADAYEEHWFGATNLIDDATTRDATGFTLSTKILAGINPTNPAPSVVTITNNFKAWKICDSFVANWPHGTTNLVYERTFNINRKSKWQQFYVSASTNAAAWSLKGMALEWEDSNGASGEAVHSSADDSLLLPLSTNNPSTVTLRLRATAPQVKCAQSLYLLAYMPTIDLEGGCKVGEHVVYLNGSESQITLKVDRSLRPHKGTLTEDERDLTELQLEAPELAYEGDANGGTLAVYRPGIYPLPYLGVPSNGGSLIVLSPSVGWSCASHGHCLSGVYYDWFYDEYAEDDEYPFDSKCLRKMKYREYGGGVYADDCHFTCSTGMGDDQWPVTTTIDGNTGTICVNGEEVWSGSAEHVIEGGGGSNDDGAMPGEEDDCACECDCANGNCDALEGASLGSLRFRIPLGSPEQGVIAGFVYLKTDAPLAITCDAFSVATHPDANVSDYQENGWRIVVCNDNRGRQIVLENIVNGVRFTVLDAAQRTLEHTWEVTNVNGDTATVRLRKISRLNNVMSDETFCYNEGDWTRFDNISQLGEELTTDYLEGYFKREVRTLRDTEDTILSQEVTYYQLIGECDNAVMRVIERYEDTGENIRHEVAEYWYDPQHKARHGLLRLKQGNACAWEYHDYDTAGRETLCITQRNASLLPQPFSTNALVDAFMTYYTYSGTNAKPSSEVQYVVRDGVPTLISEKEMCYTPQVVNGLAALKTETWRGELYSYTIAYDEDAQGVPLMLRGQIIESLDENGVRTENTYAQTANTIIQTSRRVGDLIYKVTERDVTYGNTLREATYLTANDVMIDEERSTYDDKNRLRSTTYSDGTSLTNAYSCCRLLWRRDRDGKRIVRTATTGYDHLYYANEDVWLADISTNGAHRVTHHYFDALGRETNTTITVGNEVITTRDTYYYYGGSDNFVTYDERGGTHIHCEELRTNGVARIDVDGELQTTSLDIFGGAHITRREQNGKWVENILATDYDTNGHRLEFNITHSHDYGVVTNSITEHDLLGRVVIVTTPMGVTTNEYEGARLARTLDASGATIHLYNACGDEVGTEKWNVTNRTDVTYEEMSNEWWRVTTSIEVGTTTNRWARERVRCTGLGQGMRGQTITEVLPNRWLSTTQVDDAYYLTSSYMPPSTNHFAHGVILRTDGSSGVTQYEFDALGRTVAKMVNGVREDYVYNGAGDLVEQTAHGFTALNYYDLFGRRYLTRNALGESVYYNYDWLGNVTSVSGDAYPIDNEYDSLGHRTRLLTYRTGSADATCWHYDSATGLCTNKVFADGSCIEYQYTPDGLLSATIQPSGQWLENIYDARRQLVATRSNDSAQDATFVRDEFGRITRAANAVAAYDYSLSQTGVATNELITLAETAQSVVRELDDQGRIVANNSQRIIYRADGNVATITSPDAVVQYHYADDGYALGYTLALTNGTTFVQVLTRDANRRDLVLRLENKVNGVTVTSYDYTYDALSRPLTRNTDSFEYNTRGELVAMNATRYGYDAIGNSTNYYANALNQYSDVASYNTDGAMTSFDDWTYTYDSASRLVSIASNGTLVVSNVYDHASRRIRKITPSSTHTFFYDDWNLITELVTTSTTTNRIDYYWGRDTSTPGALLYLKQNDEIFVPLYDAFGNIVEYRSSSGILTTSFSYDAFGNASNSSAFAFRYSTKYFDCESQLYYYGYRFYSPTLSRWLTRDPIAEQGGLNLYSFCANNPISRFDPDGHAYFAYRPLDIVIIRDFNVIITSKKQETYKQSLLHVQLYYENGENIGYFNDGRAPHADESNVKYLPAKHNQYKDCIMRKAEKKVQIQPYELSIFFSEMGNQYNCQNYAEDLIMWYNILSKDPKVMKECCGKD